MLTRTSTVKALSVKLPFLALSRRTEEGSVPAECPDASGYALAFTSLVNAGSYLQSFQSSDFELELIFRQSVASYLDALERDGLLGVGFDANANRTNTFTVAELRAMFDQ